MEIVAIIPALVCLVVIFTRDTQVALKNVVLPTMLLMPMYYSWTLRPLPSISFQVGAMFALGIGMVVQDLPRWRFSRADVWVGIFAMTSFYANYAGGRSTDAFMSLFGNMALALFPYMAGKLLFEYKGARAMMSSRIIWCLAISAVVSTYEYFAKANPYGKIFNHFFPSQWSGWVTQLRWGFGRVAGPFSQSELAGIIFSIGFMLSLWLATRKYQEAYGPIKLPQRLKRPRWAIGLLLMIILMTQARGPWIGTVLALMIAFIGRAQRPVLRAVIVVGLIVGIGAPVYLWGKDYLAGPRKDYGSERETAQYRAELIDHYIPVAIQGGWWGWGNVFPRIDGQVSIDNEYLFVCMLQGFIGAGVFCLLILEGMLNLVLHAARSNLTEERHFTLTLLGIVVGMAFTIGTVFLGDQTYPMFFLLLGWAQGVGSYTAPRPMPSRAGRAKVVAEPAMLRVYT